MNATTAITVAPIPPSPSSSRYRFGTIRPMAMNLRLDDEEAAALREAATAAGLSMQQAARRAIREWIERSRMLSTAELMSRPPLVMDRDTLWAAIRESDAELDG